MNQPSHITFYDDKGTAVAKLDLSLVSNTVVHREWSIKPEEWPITEGQINQVVAHFMEQMLDGNVTIGEREFRWQAG